MDTTSKLCSKIMDIVNKLGDTQDSAINIYYLLNDYNISSKKNQDETDIKVQIEIFLGAKKIEGLSDKTLKNYRLYITKFSQQINKSADDIQASDIRLFLSLLKVKANSLVTITNIMRSFFTWLTTEEFITKNPMLKIKILPQRDKNLRKSLSVEELEKLRNHCNSVREKALLELFYSTGCRLSEVSNININDVNFENRTIHIIGKGNKERIVRFSTRAKIFLEEYIKARNNDSKHLFTNLRYPFLKMLPRSIQKVVDTIGKNALINKKVHPHLLRHTFATMSLNKGMDITIIQYLLGHSQLSTTELYAKVDLNYIHHIYDKIIA